MSARWLDPKTHPQIMNAVRMSIDHVGECEDLRIGKNRGEMIDVYNKVSGSPIGSAWCANFVTWVFRQCGLWTPKAEAGAVRRWQRDLIDDKRWLSREKVPPIGAVVIYGGKDGIGSHIGIVVRNEGLVLSVEGNTTVEGAAYASSREGVVVSLKELTAGDPILGYGLPKVLPT